MALPKLDHPTFEVTIPSTKTTCRFRPFLVREEKILLMAQSGNDDTDIISAIKQIVSNCLISDIDVDKLATFDIEYLFIKIRAASINNITKVSYIDNEDSKTYSFDVDLNTIEIVTPEIDKNIAFTEKSGIKMKYPEASLFSDKPFITNPMAFIDKMVMKCIDQVYDDDIVTTFSDEKEEDQLSYIDNLDTKTYEKIKEFVNNIPYIKYVIKYTNSNGTEREIILSSLKDFFML